MLAIYEALKMIEEGKGKKSDKYIKKLIYCRPIVKEKRIEQDLGAVPGEFSDKTRELYNGLYHNLEFILGFKGMVEFLEKGIVETAVLSNMRGSSFSSSFIVLDEASLLHRESFAMKLFLTRIGNGSKAVILGDHRQSTLDVKEMDMLDAMDKLDDLKEVACVRLDDYADVQRSEIVRKILQKYEG